jgi:hypothetical protein
MHFPKFSNFSLRRPANPPAAPANTGFQVTNRQGAQPGRSNNTTTPATSSTAALTSPGGWSLPSTPLTSPITGSRTGSPDASFNPQVGYFSEPTTPATERHADGPLRVMNPSTPSPPESPVHTSPHSAASSPTTPTMPMPAHTPAPMQAQPSMHAPNPGSSGYVPNFSRPFGPDNPFTPRIGQGHINQQGPSPQPSFTRPLPPLPSGPANAAHAPLRITIPQHPRPPATGAGDIPDMSNVRDANGMTKKDHFLAAGFTPRPEPTGHTQVPGFPATGSAPYRGSSGSEHGRSPTEAISPLDHARTELRNQGVRVPSPETSGGNAESRIRAPKNRRQAMAEPALPTISEGNEPLAPNRPTHRSSAEMSLPAVPNVPNAPNAPQQPAQEPKSSKWYNPKTWGRKE